MEDFIGLIKYDHFVRQFQRLIVKGTAFANGRTKKCE